MKDEKTSHRILIVDDDVFLLDMYARKFSQRNFQVMSAGGSSQALEKLRSGEVPDILLVDLMMPAMDGFAFLEQLKKEQLASNALIIVLSNLGQQEDIDRAMQLGVASYIVKASATPTEVVEHVLEGMKKRNK